ncbi:hypothetical protein [Haloprofundus salilacus]|uniref:hypothetical protein n=1 Tax=Haloprofundus salilacus TaxID=2876190 RepID=UPI001CC940A5|nr:hypothetical protein [Haloprofundus salilacus]
MAPPLSDGLSRRSYLRATGAALVGTAAYSGTATAWETGPEIDVYSNAGIAGGSPPDGAEANTVDPAATGLLEVQLFGTEEFDPTEQVITDISETCSGTPRFGVGYDVEGNPLSDYSVRLEGAQPVGRLDELPTSEFIFAEPVYASTRCERLLLANAFLETEVDVTVEVVETGETETYELPDFGTMNEFDDGVLEVEFDVPEDETRTLRLSAEASFGQVPVNGRPTDELVVGDCNYERDDPRLAVSTYGCDTLVFTNVGVDPAVDATVTVEETGEEFRITEISGGSVDEVNEAFSGQTLRIRAERADNSQSVHVVDDSFDPFTLDETVEIDVPACSDLKSVRGVGTCGGFVLHNPNSFSVLVNAYIVESGAADSEQFRLDAGETRYIANVGVESVDFAANALVGVRTDRIPNVGVPSNGENVGTVETRYRNVDEACDPNDPNGDGHDDLVLFFDMRESFMGDRYSDLESILAEENLDRVFGKLLVETRDDYPGVDKPGTYSCGTLDDESDDVPNTRLLGATQRLEIVFPDDEERRLSFPSAPSSSEDVPASEADADVSFSSENVAESIRADPASGDGI